MKFKKILVTGGAGFVGSHLCRDLAQRGYRVRVLDNLEPQVHGKKARRPPQLSPHIEWVKGSVVDPKVVEKAIRGVDAVCHLAAAVGVGQSMYRIRHYVEANSLGGATVLEAIVRHRKEIKKVLVASSMSIYGEGAYQCSQCGPVAPTLRSVAQFKKKEWDLQCPACSQNLKSVPTPESKPVNPTSVYAVTKRDHEENFMLVGLSYQIPTVALRFFNIYGPFQALSNPYTGVAAIFSSRLLNRQPPLVFEDGGQSRDFIHVSDIVQGLVLALTKSQANYQVYNVGTGKPTSILEMANLLANHLGLNIKPKLLNKFRAGDVRHCYADISKIQHDLGYHPQVDLKSGVSDLIAWVRLQTGQDRVNQAVRELNKMGLVR